MPASLRSSLLALLLAGSLVPIAGMAALEYRALAESQAARERTELTAESLAAALRADAAAGQGLDPLVAAAQGARADEVLLMDPEGSFRSTLAPRAWPELRKIAGDSLAGQAQIEDPEGDRRLVSWARAPAANALVVLVREPPSFVSAPPLPFVILALFLAGGVALTLVFVALRVIAPVAALERASLRLARGEWHERAPVEGPAEVRAVAEAFNTMAAALERQRAELDALLDERTRALVDTLGDLDALRFTLAHEFREPLRSLRWMADDLLERPLRAADRGSLLVLRRRIDDVDSVFRDLLRYEDVSRRPAPIERVALADMLRRAHEEVQRAEPLRVEAEALPHVRANGDLLATAFEEILRNAARHARPEGGTATARVGAERDGDEVTLHFDDEGPGIPPARREDALHLFQRLRRDAPGTGAGLAIARRAIERNGGSLALEEAPGGGARVTIRLPLRGPEPATPLPREPPRRRF